MLQLLILFLVAGVILTFLQAVEHKKVHAAKLRSVQKRIRQKEEHDAKKALQNDEKDRE